MDELNKDVLAVEQANARTGSEAEASAIQLEQLIESVESNLVLR